MDSNEKKNKNQKRKYIIISIIAVIALSLASFVFLYLDYGGDTVPGTADFWVNFIILAMLCILFVAASGFLIFEKHKEHKQRTTDDSSIYKMPRVLCVLYYAAALLTPNIFLFTLYNRNYIEVYMPFNYVIIWAGIFLIASLAIYFSLRFVVRSLEARLAITTLLWGAFWVFGSMDSVVQSIVYYTAHAVLLLMLAIIFIALTGVLVKFQAKLPRVRKAFTALAVYLCVIFIFNAYSGIRNAVILEQADSADNQEQLLFRTDFNIDPSLSSPDIYWFWMDGMMSFETMEYFFGNTLDNERSELEKRGFTINESAKINSSRTRLSIPILFSPEFYDEFLGGMLEPVNNLPVIGPRPMHVESLLDAYGINLRDISSKNELFLAFEAAGYQIIGNGEYGWGREMTSPFHKFYITEPSLRPLGIAREGRPHLGVRLLGGGLGHLLGITTPLQIMNILDIQLSSSFTFHSIPVYYERIPPYDRACERQLYINLMDSLSYHPKFMFTDIPYSHPDYFSHHFLYYPQAYEFSLSVMFNAIDMVLNSNPNAIIILQSDHGFHSSSLQQTLYESGYSLETIAYLQRSVLSAVRIPEQYGGLDAPLDPRNIARELINRFVGPNYDLLL